MRQCAWSGDEFDTKGYVLQSTEGPEVVSEKSLRETRGTTDKVARGKIDEMMAVLAEFGKRLDAIESQLKGGKG